jgi:hypothetical protein
MALTKHTEAGFQRQLKTGVVDLSAANDTVWRDKLVLKFMSTVPCANISNLLKPFLSSVSRKTEQQMVSIKQWFTVLPF